MGIAEQLHVRSGQEIVSAALTTTGVGFTLHPGKGDYKMLSIGQTLTAEQRVQKAVMEIMGQERYAWLTGVLMVGERTVEGVSKTPTASTNGKDERYGREFVDSLTDPELRFVVIHENFHKCWRHLVTWYHLWLISASRANRSADYFINQLIVDENQDGFAVMPQCGLLDERFRGMNTVEIFNILEDEGDSDVGGNKGPQGFDDHDWEGAQELTEEEQRELSQDIEEAIRQGAILAGKLGTGGSRALKDLLKPQINWREIMREFITTHCAGNDYSTFRRPNRRYVAAGYYMPSGISERVEELVIAGDMSGSIGDREVSVILTEVKSVCDTVHPEAGRLLYWDTKVCADEKYEGPDIDNIVSSTRPKGGGGTDVTCVPAHMAEHNIAPQAAIIITDGYLYGGWGQWNCPVLWVIIDNEDAKPDCGVAIHVTSREL